LDSEATKEAAEQQPSISKYAQIIRHTWPFKEYYSSPPNTFRKHYKGCRFVPH
jgi:hypothetical protein